MDTPKPAPFKRQVELKKIQEKVLQEAAPIAPVKTDKLQPINLESPDGERVVTVIDPVKAVSMTNKGWKVTTRKKTPYVAPEHLTQRPLSRNPELEKLRRELTDAEKPKTKRMPQKPKTNSFRKGKN